jgi:hypothetical protein
VRLNDLDKAAVIIRVGQGAGEQRLGISANGCKRGSEFGMMPTLARLRTAADLDGPKAYDDLKAAAAEGFAKLQQTELDALARNL